MSRKKTNGPSDYDVGRGRPPREYQFKPGQSGNPGGRRKGVPNLKTLITRIMESKIELTENGRRRRVAVAEAISLKLVQQALAGESRAAERLLDRYERYCAADDSAEVELPEEDKALLARPLAKYARPPLSAEDKATDSPDQETDEEKDDVG